MQNKYIFMYEHMLLYHHIILLDRSLKKSHNFIINYFFESNQKKAIDNL